MNYETFKKVIVEMLNRRLLEVEPGCELQQGRIRTGNEVKDALMLCRKMDTNTSVSPLLLFDQVFENYNKDQDLLRVLEKIIQYFFSPRVKHILDKKNIVINLINRQENKELLKTIPHRPFLDLAITYRFMVEIEDGFTTALISNDLSNMLNLPFDLHQLALENTKRLFPLKIEKNTDYMYIVTNQQHIEGSALLALPDTCNTVKEQIGDDFYILPSSVHEVLIIPKEHGSHFDLLQMVTNVNASILSADDFLADSVYFYDSKKEEISIVATEF